ncbi:hypothetical protein TNCT_382591 [Trichonephila clavata]|uniref:Uncharacterized protein n=1 Tax=Trichonephila clavata TaxID=2740835 RepID=A0A8X6K5F3_TRICU|nr:hypothetical protein TNCT_382591 [Trichonephila clavata]
MHEKLFGKCGFTIESSWTKKQASIAFQDQRRNRYLTKRKLQCSKFQRQVGQMEEDTDNLELCLNTLLEPSNVNTSELSVKKDFATCNVKLQSINLPEFSGQYIITGSIQNDQSNYYFCNFIRDQVDENLTKFWDLEAIEIKEESNCDPDDQAMQHFKSSEQYPAATEMLDPCLYVDDIISTGDDIFQALKLSKDADTIMKNASMTLRKWNSNNQTLMRTWEGLIHNRKD